VADRLGWRKTTAQGTEADLRGYLQELLNRIAAAPGQRAKVVLVTSGQPGAGKGSVARSLNDAAIERGMLSVLIQIAPEPTAAPQRPLPAVESAANRGRVLRTTARSLGLLLGDGGELQTTVDSGDVRSEFDLIVIDAPALGQQADLAAIAAHADFTILVAMDNAAWAGIVRRAKAALGKLDDKQLGIVINRADPRSANPANHTGRDRYSDRTVSLAQR
jgi:Mrp family chromosome partitioning ATPase